MKKRFFLFALVICLLCSSFVFAQGNGLFNVTTYDFRLFWNGNELNFDSPVLLVDGETYVPLRKLAEETGMDVNWNGVTREIRMTESNFWFEDIFFDALGFEIPITADIVDYAYGRNGRDIHLDTKIFFKKDDLEQMKDCLDKIATPLIDEENDPLEDVVLMNLSKRFDWWNLTTVQDAKYSYHGFAEGYEATTINIWGFICEAPNLDGYYLYISC